MITTLVEIEHIKEFDEQGFYSRTYLAKDKRLDRTVAVKDIFPKDVKSKEDLEAYFAEAHKLSLTEHPRILPVYFVGLNHVTEGEEDIPRIVTKYMKGGSLEVLLRNTYAAGKTLTIEQIVRYAHDIIQGMIHLHANDILHLDLKASNIFIGDDEKLVIGDFGLAKFLKDDAVIKAGSLYPAFNTPENIKKGVVDKTADIYQFGVLMYSMLNHQIYRDAVDGKYKLGIKDLEVIKNGNKPTEEQSKQIKESFKMLGNDIKSGAFPDRKNHNYYVPKKICELIEKCLNPEVSKRFNNFYQVQAALNEFIMPDETRDVWYDFTNFEVAFSKRELPCTIKVNKNGTDFDLLPLKNGKKQHQQNKSAVSPAKLSSSIYSIIDEI